MSLRFSVLLYAVLTFPALAQQSPVFPRDSKFIIQLTSSQFASGFGEYLVPPLIEAFLKTGMTYSDGADANFAATVETWSDVGKWYGEGEDAAWLYERFVTVGLSPAEVDIEPHGQLSPSFSITAMLVTPNADRVDELNCLIALATFELAGRYKAKGHIVVDGNSCSRE